jgi:hypothetical protein
MKNLKERGRDLFYSIFEAFARKDLKNTEVPVRTTGNDHENRSRKFHDYEARVLAITLRRGAFLVFNAVHEFQMSFIISSTSLNLRVTNTVM